MEGKTSNSKLTQSLLIICSGGVDELHYIPVEFLTAVCERFLMSRARRNTRAREAEHIAINNVKLLSQLEMGDLIEFPRRDGYSHWAVYVGDGQVVHLAGEDNDGITTSNSTKLFSVAGKKFNKALVLMEDLLKVAEGDKAFKNNMKDKTIEPMHPEAIVQCAVSKLGKVGYNVLWNNCEHFASFCRYGKKHSEQVKKVTTNLITGGLGGGVGMALGAVVGGPIGAAVGSTLGGAIGAAGGTILSEKKGK